jgi:myosin heavy subunit
MPLDKNKKRKKKKPKSTSVDDMETIPSLFDRSILENINNYMEQMTPR